MNSVYRSIWNECLGAWVAVSECQSAQGKPSKAGRQSGVGSDFSALRKAALSASLGLTLTAVSQAVLAACPPGTADGGEATAGSTCTVTQPFYTGALGATGSGTVLNVGSTTLHGTTGSNINLDILFGRAATPAPDAPPSALQGLNNTVAIKASSSGTVNLQGDTTIYAAYQGEPAGLYAITDGVINSSGKVLIYGVNTGYTLPLISAHGGVINLRDVAVYQATEQDVSTAIAARGGGQVNVTGETYVRIDGMMGALGITSSNSLGAAVSSFVRLGTKTQVDSASIGGNQAISALGTSGDSPSGVIEFSPGVSNGLVKVRTEASGGIWAGNGGKIDFSGGTLDVKVGVPVLNDGVNTPLKSALSEENPYASGIEVYGPLSIFKYANADVVSHLGDAVFAIFGGEMVSTGTTRAEVTRARHQLSQMTAAAR